MSASISNDRELRQALEQLDNEQKREVGALFVDEVLNLTNDSRITHAIEAAHNKNITDSQLEDAFRSAKKAMIESRNQCGVDCNWDDQTVHFVARAATAVVTPEDQTKASDSLWQAVQSCRMARNCALISNDDDAENPEAKRQYKILNEFLAATYA